MKKNISKIKKSGIGLSALLGLSLPITLAVACGSSVAAQIVTEASIPVLDGLITNEGILSLNSGLVGWNVDIVNESTDEAISKLLPGQSYRIKFDLQTDFTIPTGLPTELIVSPQDASAYYTEIAIFNPVASELLSDVQLEYSSSNNGIALPILTGWNVEAFEADGFNTPINSGTTYSGTLEHFFQFTLLDGYSVDYVDDTIRFDETNNIYTSETKTLAEILPSDSEIFWSYDDDTQTYSLPTFGGWNTYLYNGQTDEIITELDEISTLSTWYFGFELSSLSLLFFYANPDLEVVLSGREYRTRVFRLADEINENTKLAYDFETNLISTPNLQGWDISVLESDGVTPYTNFNETLSGEYTLKFELQSNFNLGTVNGLNENDDGSYTSAILNFQKSSFLDSQMKLTYNAMNDLYEIPVAVGWDITVWSEEDLTEITDFSGANMNGRPYFIQFVHQSEYYFTGAEQGVQELVQGSIYRTNVIDSAAALDTLQYINFDLDSQSFGIDEYQGWTTTIHSAENDAEVSLDSIVVDKEYYIRFTLVDNYIFNEVSDTFTEITANEVYQSQPQLITLARFLAESDPLLDLTYDETTSTFGLPTIEGWTISVFVANDQDVEVDVTSDLSQITTTTEYSLRFTLQDGYLFYGQSGLLTVAANEVFETVKRTFSISSELTSKTNLNYRDLNNDGTVTLNLPIVKGYLVELIKIEEDLSEVNITNNPELLVENDKYYLKFTLLDGFVFNGTINNSISQIDSTTFRSLEKKLKFATDDFSAAGLLYDYETELFRHQSLTGWTINVYNSAGEEINVNVDLVAGSEYYIQYTINNGYVFSGITNENLFFDIVTFQSVYRTERRTIAYADNLSENLDFTYNQNTSNLDFSYIEGWDATIHGYVNGSLDLGQIVTPSEITNGSQYRILFKIKPGYFFAGAASNYDAFVQNELYLSSAIEINYAEHLAIDNVNLIFDPTGAGSHTLPTINGWNIELYSASDDTKITDFTTLTNGYQYYFKFTLLDNFHFQGQTGFTSETINSVYVSGTNEIKVAEQISLELVYSEENGEVSYIPNIAGWNVEVFTNIRDPLPTDFKVVNGFKYRIRYTLDPTYSQPEAATLNLQPNDLNQYITDEKAAVVSTRLTLENTKLIWSPDATLAGSGFSLPSLTGWDITVYKQVSEGVDEIVPEVFITERIVTNDSYRLRFTLQEGYLSGLYQEDVGFVNQYQNEQIQVTSPYYNVVRDIGRRIGTWEFEQLHTIVPLDWDPVGSNQTEFEQSAPFFGGFINPGGAGSWTHANNKKQNYERDGWIFSLHYKNGTALTPSINFRPIDFEVRWTPVGEEYATLQYVNNDLLVLQNDGVTWIPKVSYWYQPYVPQSYYYGYFYNSNFTKWTVHPIFGVAFTALYPTIVSELNTNWFFDQIVPEY